MAEQSGALVASVGGGGGDFNPNPDWDPGVLDALYEAAFSQPEAEIVGVLVGYPTVTAMAGRIVAMIPASTARPPARATLGHAEWAYIHSMMAQYYAGLDIVGWWVSRPGSDTDLSESERLSAGTLFGRPNQIGFVFDSIHRQAALYAWHEGAYVKVHAGPVPRHLTRARPTGSRWSPALQALGVGLLIGLLAWAATGFPALA